MPQAPNTTQRLANYGSVTLFGKDIGSAIIDNIRWDSGEPNATITLTCFDLAKLAEALNPENPSVDPVLAAKFRRFRE